MFRSLVRQALNSTLSPSTKATGKTDILLGNPVVVSCLGPAGGQPIRGEQQNHQKIVKVKSSVAAKIGTNKLS